MDLHRTLLKDVILPKVKSVYVVDYYEGVRGLLESRNEFPYKSIFANPRFRSKTEILWSTDLFDSAPKKLCELAGEEKNYYSHLLYIRIQAVRNLIDILKSEEGGSPLSELLSRVISNIDDKSVYCGDNEVVIVNWGLIPRQADLGGACIFRSGKFIGNWEQAHKSNPHTQFVENNTETTHDVETPNIKELEEEEPKPASVDIPTDVPTQPLSQEVTSEHTTPKNTSEDNTEPEATTNQDNENLAPPELKTVDDTTINADTDITTKPNVSNLADTDPIQDKTEGVVKAEREEGDKPVPPYVPSDHYNWNRFFKNTLRGLMFLLKKLWWLILFILLALLSLFLFRDCQGYIHRINPFYNPLPEKPIIMPIEKGGVVMSEDGMSQVANDRLTIILEKTGEDTMLEWAKAFKKEYPSADYEIKYYNKELYTLQIKVPVKDRLKVKNELKQKLSDFSFDVIEENVYESDFSANDPALTDDRASWYLNAINAYSAWDMTQGSEEVTVAVIDNGFDLTHPEIAGKIVSPYNVLTQNADIKPIRTAKGIDGHGTHVASTAVGVGNNGNGLLGIAPKCKLMPVQVGNDNPEGSMSGTAIIEGVLYAIDHGADVINISLGMYAPRQVAGMSESEQLNYISNSFRQEEEMWDRVFDKAMKRDCIVVLAAGNDNIISGIDPKKRNANTVRVSAVAPNGAKAQFSNFGRYPNLKRDYSTLSAPGVDIFNAVPGNKYEYMNGTSMAAPIVTGAIALLRSVNKSISVAEAISILQQTGTDVGASIGPQINLGRAVAMALGKDNGGSEKDCDKISKEIERLQARIDSLRRLCPQAKEPNDTLKYADAIKDKHGIDGTWKSTTNLIAEGSQSKIELYMTFKNLKGTLIIVENGVQFRAALRANIKGKSISIRQLGPAKSSQSSGSFLPYKYTCAPDRKGNLYCRAKSEANTVEFNLVRIR